MLIKRLHRQLFTHSSLLPLTFGEVCPVDSPCLAVRSASVALTQRGWGGGGDELVEDKNHLQPLFLVNRSLLSPFSLLLQSGDLV